MKAIGKDSKVSLHFDIRLKDGSVAESTRNFDKPFVFKMGTGIFAEKLEQGLIGLKQGAKPKIMLLPEEAFGEAHPANIFQVPRHKFDTEQLKNLEIGTIFLFTQPRGEEIPGIIRAIEGDEITVDFNHPLAGQVILFDMEIVAVD